METLSAQTETHLIELIWHVISRSTNVHDSHGSPRHAPLSADDGAEGAAAVCLTAPFAPSHGVSPKMAQSGQHTAAFTAKPPGIRLWQTRWQ